MLIPPYSVLVLKLSTIYMVSLNTVFSIPQNQCYQGTPCIEIDPRKQKKKYPTSVSTNDLLNDSFNRESGIILFKCPSAMINQ